MKQNVYHKVIFFPGSETVQTFSSHAIKATGRERKNSEALFKFIFMVT